jgi:ppGpp synthetase/RelA/SpoT-type nucleotidyltranferase
VSETREDVPGEARETVSVELYKYHYLLYRDELLRAATAFEAAVKDALDRAAIPCHSVEARAKTHSSFTVKADRRIGERYKYADPLSEVKDCIAARVMSNDGYENLWMALGFTTGDVKGRTFPRMI